MLLANYDKLTKEFLDYLKDNRGYPDVTIKTYKIVLEQLRGKYKIDNATGKFDIREFRVEIVELNKKTIVKKLSAIRSFIEFLYDQKDIEFQIVGDDTIKVPQRLPKPIENRYIEEVLSSSSLLEKTIVYMLYGLGIRISELASIKLIDIKSEWILINGKGAKQRELPLLPILSSIINQYRAFANPNIYLLEKKDKPLNTNQIRYIVNKVFKANGIKVSPHQLRHSFATDLLNEGARVSDISKLLGHSTMASTQLYTKLANSTKLNEYLNSHPLCKD